MSQENVEIVRRLLDMFAKRDHEAVFAFYDPDIEWDATNVGARGLADLTGVYRGHGGVRTYWRRWLEAWKDLEFEVQDVLDAGDEIVALIRNQRQWGRSSGIITDMPPYGLVFTIRGGRVVRWRSFPDQESALEAAGLSEQPMSQENVERLRAFLEQTIQDIPTFVDAAKRGDVDMSLLDSDVVYEDANLPDHIGEAYRGHEGIVRAAERWAEASETLSISLERIVGSGDHLVSIHTARSKARHSGIEFEEPLAYTWTLRDGKVIHFQSFRDPDQALKAAGLAMIGSDERPPEQSER